MPPVQNFDVSKLDLSKVLADKEAIRRVNLQRFEMEQIDAIVLNDLETNTVAGYKDIREDDFWVRGHMPGHPLMPGVVMCEVAAQVSSFFIVHNKLMKCDFVGFGGMDNVRFRNPVRIGDRLLVVSKLLKLHRLQVITSAQGFVGNQMMFNADIIGVPLYNPKEG